jgi:hypothetical protein
MLTYDGKSVASYGGGDGIADVDIDNLGFTSVLSALDPQGRIVIATIKRDEVPTDADFQEYRYAAVMLRVTPDGALDTSFGGGDG